jgi:DNA-directed RNA polymerase subunit RPC12/RpoP
MAVRAGELARETAVYCCESCSEQFVVIQGAVVRECPGCGHHAFSFSWRGIFAPAAQAAMSEHRPRFAFELAKP